jgi:hypothetical protein
MAEFDYGPLHISTKPASRDVQQVCLNGHQITDGYNKHPELREDHCTDCGAPTITKCPKCQAEIPGHLTTPGVTAIYNEEVPDHCHKCGAPYPWTEAEALEEQTSIEDFEKVTGELPAIFDTLSLSNNWRVASSALAAFEILIKQKLEDLGLSTSGTYEERVTRLAPALKKKGIPFDELMVSSLKTARNKVLHEGKEPTETELRDIMKYLKTTTLSLFPGN